MTSGSWLCWRQIGNKMKDFILLSYYDVDYAGDKLERKIQVDVVTLYWWKLGNLDMHETYKLQVVVLNYLG